MKVLIIPEDFRNDEFVLKPLFTRLFASFNKANAKVTVCKEPLLQGVSEALKEDRLREIIERYPMIDIFVLCVDRDGIPTRQDRLTQLEGIFRTTRPFLAVNAWEELETWVLAGLELPKDWVWADIRREISVKERYFEPLARQFKVSDGPGGGRKMLADQAARRLPTIQQKCPEDFGAISNRLAAIASS